MLEDARHAFQNTSPVTTVVTWNLKSFDAAASFKNRHLQSDTVIEHDRASYWRWTLVALTVLYGPPQPFTTEAAYICGCLSKQFLNLRFFNILFCTIITVKRCIHHRKLNTVFLAMLKTEMGSVMQSPKSFLVKRLCKKDLKVDYGGNLS